MLTQDVCSCKVSCKVFPLEPRVCVCVRACVRACARVCVRASVRPCVRASVRPCVRACVCLCVSLYLEAEADVLAVYALVPMVLKPEALE